MKIILALLFVGSFIVTWTNPVENPDFEKDEETSDLTDGQSVWNGKIKYSFIMSFAMTMYC